jgi:hypothetical protein
MVSVEEERGAVIVLPIVLAFALVAVAVVVDVRTGRGYGLAVLSFLLLAATVLVFTAGIIIAQTPSPPPPGIHDLGPGFVLLLYWVAAVYATLLILIGAVIVAGIAGQWRWIVGFFVAVLVPVVVAAAPHLFLDGNAETVVQNVGFIGVLVVPEATMLAFSIRRIVRPIGPAAARQPAARQPAALT